MIKTIAEIVYHHLICLHSYVTFSVKSTISSQLVSKDPTRELTNDPLTNHQQFQTLERQGLELQHGVFGKGGGGEKRRKLLRFLWRTPPPGKS